MIVVLLAHGPHDHAATSGGLPLEAFSLALIAVVGVAYVVAAMRRSREPRGWSPWRTASFVLGLAVLAAGVVPLSPFPAGSFPEHMYQHMVIGMYAPLGLVLGAPVTLLLRSTPRSFGRGVMRFLRLPPVRFVANPVTALVLDIGTLWLLYLTPLFTLMTSHVALHHLVHVHFFAAGYLFAYVIAGPDPAPRRPSVPARLVVLGVAIVGHAVLAQLIYAGLFVDLPVPAGERRAGGDLMYFSGDIAELLLALAMVSTWRPERRASRALGDPPDTVAVVPARARSDSGR